MPKPCQRKFWRPPMFYRKTVASAYLSEAEGRFDLLCLREGTASHSLLLKMPRLSNNS